MFKYEFTSKAIKQLRKLDTPIQIRIIDKLDEISKNQVLPKDTQHLTDFRIGGYRIRIGDFRVIFDLEESTLIILKIGHRRNIYK